MKTMPQQIKLAIQVLYIFLGALTFLGALFQWGWFVNSPNFVRFARLVGPPAARAVHILLGLGIAILGILMALGVVPM